MTRKHRSTERVSKIADRFNSVVAEHLKIKYSELSEKLGYANPSTLASVKKGKTIPDFVRLAEYGDVLRDCSGRKINLHWLITGDGESMVSEDQNENDIIITIKKMDIQKKKRLFRLLLDELVS